MAAAVFVPAIIKGVVDIWQSWVEAKKAKHEADAKFQMVTAEHAHEWDLVAQRAAQTSWKDELITVIVFLPLMLWWFPSFREDAKAWVEFVGQMPDWYVLLFFGIAAASFGLRWLISGKVIRGVDFKETSNG